jgi:hypothetical protein
MHSIRLRAAWAFDGEVAVRRFNRPTGLAAGDRVWLVWEGEAAGAELNVEPLGSGGRHEVGGRLRRGNVLRMSAPPAVLETVRLEIEPAAR